MNTRLQLTSGNALVGDVTGLRADVDSIKINQRVGGAGLVTYNNRHTASSWDWTVTLAPGQIGLTTVSFVAAQQDYPFARITYKLFYGTATNEIRPNDPAWPVLRVTPLWADPASPKTAKWSVWLTSPISGTTTYYMQFWIISSDQGASLSVG